MLWGVPESPVARAVLEVLNDPAVQDVIRQVIEAAVRDAHTGGERYVVLKEKEDGEKEVIEVDWFYKQYDMSAKLLDSSMGVEREIRYLVNLHNMLNNSLVDLHNMLNNSLVDLHNMLNNRLA